MSIRKRVESAILRAVLPNINEAICGSVEHHLVDVVARQRRELAELRERVDTLLCRPETPRMPVSADFATTAVREAMLRHVYGGGS